MTSFASTPAGNDPGANDEDRPTPDDGNDSHDKRDSEAQRVWSASSDELDNPGDSEDPAPSLGKDFAGSRDDPDDDPDDDETPPGRYVGKVFRLDKNGFTLICYTIREVGDAVRVISVTLLDVSGPDDGPDDGPGGDDGDDGPPVPAPRGGLDCENEPAPEGGLLSIYDIFQTV